MHEYLLILLIFIIIISIILYFTFKKSKITNGKTNGKTNGADKIGMNILNFNPWKTPISFQFKSSTQETAPMVTIADNINPYIFYVLFTNTGTILLTLMLGSINIDLYELSSKRYNDNKIHLIEIKPNAQNILTCFIDNILVSTFDGLMPPSEVINGKLYKKHNKYFATEFLGVLSGIAITNIGVF